jgi:hypothetical protein
MESSRGKIMGLEGVLLVWIMGDKISEHSTNFLLRSFCWEDACNILYRILWVEEDERRAWIVNPAE